MKDQKNMETSLNQQAKIHFTQANLTPAVIDGVDDKIEQLIETKSDSELKKGLQEMIED